MMTRVLYFCGYDIALPDGPGTNELEFTRCLAKQLGKDAWCVLPEPSTPVPHLDQVNALFYSLPRLRNLPGYLASCLKLAGTIDQICSEHGIDAICARLNALPVTLWLLQRRHGRPVFLKTLGEWWHNEPPAGLLDGLVRSLGCRLQKQVIRRALGLDVAIEGVLARAEELLGGRERIAVIPNAANTDHFSPHAGMMEGLDLDGAWPVLGFVGTSPSLRGVREMVELLPRLLPDHPKAAVLAAGWDNGMDAVRARAEELGVAGRCRFLGWVDYAQVPRVVNAMDMCFSFFEPIRIEREGNCSQKVRQYLACGKPVLSIRSGHDFLEEEGLGSVVDPSDLDGVERAVRAWLERLTRDSDDVGRRLRDYAVANLSTESTFHDRMAFWSKRLEA